MEIKKPRKSATTTRLRNGLLRVGKLVITVRAAYSSMTCSECGHVDAASRKSQSEFVCTKCHHAENADTNAAKVLHRRTFDAVRDGTWAEKPKKKTAFLKRKALRATPGTSGIDGTGPAPGGDGPTPPERESDGTGPVPATHPSTKWETGPALAA